MLYEKTFLSHDECDSLSDKILELEHYWIARTRAKIPPFYTLGAASYLDAQPAMGGFRNYCEKARLFAPVLRIHFSALYDMLLSQLGKIVDGCLWYPRDLGLPGFHIFRSCIEYTFPLAAKHRDLQHNLLDRDIKQIHDILSFTVPLKLPKSGGGLNVWTPEGKQEFRNYSLGSIFYSNGNFDHQIAPFIEHEPGAYRITLQGHAIQINGHWQVYW